MLPVCRVLLELESPVSAVFLPDLGLEELQQQLEGAFRKGLQGNSVQEIGMNTEEDNYICSKAEGVGIELKSREIVESQDTLPKKYSSSEKCQTQKNPSKLKRKTIFFPTLTKLRI